MKSTTLAAAIITMFGMNAAALACGGDTTTKPKPVGERLACDGGTVKKPKPAGEYMAYSAKEDSAKADKAPPKA